MKFLSYMKLYDKHFSPMDVNTGVQKKIFFFSKYYGRPSQYSINRRSALELKSSFCNSAFIHVCLTAYSPNEVMNVITHMFIIVSTLVTIVDSFTPHHNNTEMNNDLNGVNNHSFYREVQRTIGFPLMAFSLTPANWCLSRFQKYLFCYFCYFCPALFVPPKTSFKLAMT